MAKKISKKKKPQTCSEKGTCKNHLFSINPLRSGLLIKKLINIKFCPKLNKFNDQFECTTPRYNKDQRFYIPAFILQEQKKFYNENDDRLRGKHNTKVEQAEQQESQMMVPYPNRNTNYCAVCKNEYQDYLEHLESEDHHRCIQKSKFNNYILELQKYFKRKQEENKQKQQISKIKNVGSIAYSQISTQINIVKKQQIFQQ